MNIAVVGHHDLGGRGYNADVWVYNGYAYVGQWGFGDWASGSKDRFCPSGSNTSVVILDVRNPSNPQIVGRLQNPPNTSIEDVVVYTAQYGRYKGKDIAVGGIQYCGDSRYDTNAQPRADAVGCQQPRGAGTDWLSQHGLLHARRA